MRAGRREVGDAPRRPRRAEQRGLPRVGRFRVPARIANESRSESVTGVTTIGSPGYRSLVAATAAACTGSVSNSDSSSPTWHCGVMENDTWSISPTGALRLSSANQRSVPPAIGATTPALAAAARTAATSAGAIPRPPRRARGHGQSGRPSRGVEDVDHAADRRVADCQGKLQLGTCRRCQARALPPFDAHRVASRGRCRCDGGAARGSRSRSRRQATQEAPCRPFRSPGPRHPVSSQELDRRARGRGPSRRPEATGEPACPPERHVSVTRWSNVCPAAASWTSPRLSGVEYVLNDASVQLR